MRGFPGFRRTKQIKHQTWIHLHRKKINHLISPFIDQRRKKLLHNIPMTSMQLQTISLTPTPQVIPGIKHTIIPSAPALSKTSAAQTYLLTKSAISSFESGVGRPNVLFKHGSNCTSDEDFGFGFKNPGTCRPGYCNWGRKMAPRDLAA